MSKGSSLAEGYAVAVQTSESRKSPWGQTDLFEALGSDKHPPTSMWQWVIKIIRSVEDKRLIRPKEQKGQCAWFGDSCSVCSVEVS